MKRCFYVATGILRSRYKDKLNIDKQGRDNIFYVVTKIPTQGREVLSRHKKLGRDTKMSLIQKVLSRHKNWVATENIDNTKRLCYKIKRKLQQEIRLSGYKTLLRQTFLVVTRMLIIQETLLQQELIEMLS